MALRDAGYETVMVNCNPETVSTDYDTSDRLYFEPLTAEDVANVLDAEIARIATLGVEFELDSPVTDIAAAMWNHEPRMAQSPPVLDTVEMREIVSYLWAGQFFEDSGRAAAGERLFAAKHCTACHNEASSGAPALPAAGRSFTGATMVSVLWRHGPRMMDQMNAKHIAWPRFDGSQMADVIAYLNSGGRRTQ